MKRGRANVQGDCEKTMKCFQYPLNSTRDILRSAERRTLCVFTLLLFSVTTVTVCAQQPNKIDIDRARLMLNVIKDDLKKNYYDSNYRGMNVENRFQLAED